jgi:hypothetical protein
LYIKQGTGQILFIIRHLRTPGQVQDLLLIVLGWLQNCAGVGFLVLERPYLPLPHLEGHWLTSVRDFLNYINGALEITDISIHLTQSHGNFYLMEKTIESKQFTPAEIKRCNLCRLYLGATTVSDICNAKGTHLASGVWQGQ